MITKELVEYIKAERIAGTKDSDIRQNLMSGGGWTVPDLDEGFKTANGPSRSEPLAARIPVQQAQPASIQPTPIQPTPVQSQRPPQLQKVQQEQPRAQSIAEKLQIQPQIQSQVQSKVEQQGFVSGYPVMSQPVAAFEKISQGRKGEASAPVASQTSKKSPFILYGIIALIVIIGALIAYLFFSGSFGPKPSAQSAITETSQLPVDTTQASVPVIASSTALLNQIQVSDDPWVAFEGVSLALKNKDIALYNTYSYKQTVPGEEARFVNAADLAYEASANTKKGDYVNRWQDERQAIYSTKPMKRDAAETYRYVQDTIYFIKVGDQWKELVMSGHSWNISKKDTNQTDVQIEQSLQAMMLDSDRDGLTDQEETCMGSNEFNQKCVKTNPNKIDTDGDGWWDGVQVKMK
jgi:hypothetical protein